MVISFKPFSRAYFSVLRFIFPRTNPGIFDSSTKLSDDQVKSDSVESVFVITSLVSCPPKIQEDDLPFLK